MKGLFKAKDATLDLLSAEQEMALARSKASDSIKKERAKLDILYARLKNTSSSTKERTAAVNEWIKRYPEYANILDGENINLSKLESAYKALSKEIYANAVARHYVDKVADLSVKKEKEEIKRLNQRATLMKAQRRVEQAEAEKVAAQQAQQKGLYGSGNRLSIANDELSSANKDLEKQQKIYDDIVNNVKDYDRNIKTIANHVDTLNLFPQPEEGTYITGNSNRTSRRIKEIKSDVKKTLELDFFQYAFRTVLLLFPVIVGTFFGLGKQIKSIYMIGNGFDISIIVLYVIYDIIIYLLLFFQIFIGRG